MKKAPSSMKIGNAYKVVILGGSCGKTALLECLKTGKHDASILASPTIEEDHTVKMKIGDEETVFNVKDTSGSSIYENLRPSWYSWGEAFLIVFNVSVRESLEEAMLFYSELKQHRNKEKKDPNAVILATAVDLDTDREIKINAADVAKKFEGAAFLEVSAVSGYNVNAAMKLAIEASLDCRKGRDAKLKEKKKLEDEEKKKKKEEEKKKADEEKKKKKELTELLKKSGAETTTAPNTTPAPSFLPSPEKKDQKKEQRETVSIVPAMQQGPVAKEGSLECLVGKKWRKRYYVLLQGGQFVEYENKGGKQLSFCKLSKGMSFHEYAAGKEDGEVRSFQVMIPPDTDMILKAETAQEMQLWLNEMTKQSITPQELAQIKSEQDFNNLLKNSRVPVKNIPTKYLSVDSVGCRAEQNKNNYMEDEAILFDCFANDENLGYFAVFDGHGGRQTVDFVKDHLHDYIAQAFQNGFSAMDALRVGFVEADQNLCQFYKNSKQKTAAGSTAAVLLVGWDGNDRILYAANIGDSRIVLSRNGVAERMSIDHNVNNPDEAERVRKGKGLLAGKVGGQLKVTRAFGDPELKQWVLAVPHVSYTKLAPTDKYVILASDGVWDVITDQEACDLISKQTDTTVMANLIVDTALKKGSTDNITCLVVQVSSMKNKRQEKWPEVIRKLEDHLKSGQFEPEWIALEQMEANRAPALYSDASNETNFKKNRYTDILPLNNTRVKLTPIPAEGAGSDYINASHVHLAQSSYIACSAPLPHTFIPFYRMLWEQKVNSIVMLTRCEESGVLKAHDYIPPVPTTFGDITCDIVSREPYEYFVVTQLRLTRGAESRICTHYHYLAWPDHGVPNPEPMLYMMSQVWASPTAKKDMPQVVHCSAGVGRTGTWIIIRALVEMLEQNSISYLSLMEILRDLRNQRAKALTSIQQYVFLYNTLITILYGKLYSS